MIKKSRLLMFFALVFTSILIAACSNSENTSNDSTTNENKDSETTSEQTTNVEQVFNIAVDQEPAGLDPHKTPAQSSVRIYGQTYEGLVTFDENMQIVGQLAESWEQPDDTTYIFHLVEGVKFHNGREMTADDVKYSFDRIMAEETASHIKSYFANVKAIEVVDPLTVKITVNTPDATFLTNLTNSSAVVVAKEVVEENGDLQQVVVGTGPFKFEEWVPDNHVTLVKNEDYYIEGQPKLDKVVFNTMKEESSRLSAIRTGAIDFAMVSAKSAELIKDNSDINIMNYQSLEYSYIGFNVNKEPFNNEKVRQALSLATDRQTIANIVWNGDAIISGPVAPSMGDWAIDVNKEELYQRDIEKAKQLLAEAGYENGFDTVITTASTYPDMVDTAQILQQQWKEIGVNASIKQIEWGEYIETWSNTSADILVGRNGSGIDPDRALNYFFHTDGSANVWGFSNEDFDKLVTQGKQTIDSDERHAIYTEAQKQLINLSPNLFLVSPMNFVAVRSNVEGYTPYPHNALDLVNITKK